MRANNNLRIHNVHTLGAAEPLIPCLAAGCVRRFYNRSGRSSHMRSHHPGLIPEPAEPQVIPAAPSSPQNPPSHQSSSNDDERPSSQSGGYPMPMYSRSPSRAGEAEEDIEMRFDLPQDLFDDEGGNICHNDGDETSSSSSDSGSGSSSSSTSKQDPPVAVPPHVTRTCHPTINGKVVISIVTKICDSY
jgi:hypothetical protein